jgi:hypothetical protein
VVLAVSGQKLPSCLLKKVTLLFVCQERIQTTQKIFEKAGVKDNCKLVVHGNGHYWDDKVMWTEIKNLTNKLGW